MKQIFTFLASIFIVLLSHSSVLAQIFYPTNGDIYSSATSKLFNEAYNVQLDSAKVPVVLMELQQQANTVTTDLLMEKYPNLEVPKLNITMELPALEGFTDRVVAMWFLRKPEAGGQGVVNVMLLAKNEEQQYVYFVDFNNNRNFNDDGGAVTFEYSEKQKEVVIYDQWLGELPLILQNISEQKETPRLASEQKYKKPDSMLVAKPFKLHFLASVSSGSGDAFIEFTEPAGAGQSNSGGETYHKYIATFYASMNVNVGLAVSYKNLYIGAGGGVELFQVGEQDLLINKYDANGNLSASQYINNKGNWPNSRARVTALAEYDIPITKALAFTPAISYSRFSFLSKQSFVQGDDRGMKDLLKDSYSYSIGGKVKYDVTSRSKLYLEVNRKVNSFDASEYFVNAKSGSFDTELKQIYGGVGVQFLLTGF